MDGCGLKPGHVALGAQDIEIWEEVRGEGVNEVVSGEAK